MKTIPHCRAYWPVLEARILKPDEKARHDYPDILSQIVLRGVCRSNQCKKQEIYYWYPQFANAKTGSLTRIKSRTFDQEWFPRFATDLMAEAESQDRPRLYGTHTAVIKTNDVDNTMRYLARKRKRLNALLSMPLGVTAKEIYG